MVSPVVITSTFTFRFVECQCKQIYNVFFRRWMDWQWLTTIFPVNYFLICIHFIIANTPSLFFSTHKWATLELVLLFSYVLPSLIYFPFTILLRRVNFSTIMRWMNIIEKTLIYIILWIDKTWRVVICFIKYLRISSLLP